MIQLGSLLQVSDKTGIVSVRCIKVLGSVKKHIARLGGIILVSVQKVNARRISFLKERLQKRYAKGTVHRGLIVRSKVNFKRTTGILLKFDENTIVLVTKQIVPVTNRVFGPILREFCMR